MLTIIMITIMSMEALIYQLNINKSVKVVPLTLKQRIMQELKLARKPKYEYIKEPKQSKYIVPSPEHITAYEMDIIKLTAQFEACNGKIFRREIQHEEEGNETFQFLSPIHPRFQYYQRLVDAYRTIIECYESYSHFKERAMRYSYKKNANINANVIGDNNVTNDNDEK